MKLFLINNEYYVAAYDFYGAENLYRETFTAYDDKDIKSIEMISDYLIIKEKED